MSISLLLAEVANQPAASLAQVSVKLLDDLDLAGELAVRSVPVSSDPTHPLVDQFLRGMGAHLDESASFSVSVLRRYPRVTVQPGGWFGLDLAATGAGSFNVT